MIRSILAFVVLLAVSFGVHAQQLINCIPMTPCTLSGPAMTGTGDPAYVMAGKTNANFIQLYQGPVTMATVGGVALGSPTGGGSTVVPVFCNGSAWTAH